MLNKLVFVFGFSLFAFSLSAQINKSGEINSGFADYLYNLKMYSFAAEEYERLLYTEPDNVSYIRKLIKSYRHTGEAGFLNQKLSQPSFTDPIALNAYFKLLLTEGFNDEAKGILEMKEPYFESNDLNEMKFQLALANKDWKHAHELFQANLDLDQYNTLAKEINDTNYKKPGLAAGLSAVIPGLGRFYSKDAKDGIISLIFVGTTAYQSYRRFDQNGVKSAGGWIYGSIALGFYISNIYGSYQSAKYYNNKIDTTLHEKSLYHINSDLDK